MSPAAVSAVSDLKKLEACKLSTWSALMFSASISDLVWSAVAPDSIPSNLVPSAATSLPSTVPVAVMFPVTSSPELAFKLPANVVLPALFIISLSEPASISRTLKIPLSFCISKSFSLSVSFN